jgi:hypothetical protein
MATVDPEYFRRVDVSPLGSIFEERNHAQEGFMMIYVAPEA